MLSSSIEFQNLNIYFCWFLSHSLAVGSASSSTTMPPMRTGVYPNKNSVNKLMDNSSFMYVHNENHPVIELNGFELCDPNECNLLCGSKALVKSFCAQENPKLCMCSPEDFMSSNVVGVVVPVDRKNPDERNCSLACSIQNSFARIWHKNDHSMSCNCLLNQVTYTGITLCDEFSLNDSICKSICHTNSAQCTFNGVCICRQMWGSVFNLSVPNVRKENAFDRKECSKRCKEYHTEYVARIYDTKPSDRRDYKFGEKYCICGEEVESEDSSIQERLHQSEGFQKCTGLKCRMRCGMNNEATCEPKHRRACLCPRSSISIGKFLWARLPGRKESVCLETCINNGLAPRIIEWNPFYDPFLDKSLPVYRNSRFPFLYDGKFCHCISLKNELDLNTNYFHPCTYELCQWICGHSGGACDQKTRRVCICDTHEMIAGLGRKPDHAEVACNIICRRYLNDARVLDVVWDVPAPNWTGPRSKFCGCIRPVSPAGLTHCNSWNDICPKICNSTVAYCTLDKVCECTTSETGNPLIRVPDGKEAAECGEICRSWTWPLVQDVSHAPYIYDESRLGCSLNNSCSTIDTTAWNFNQPGALQTRVDALNQRPDVPKKYCLCIKTDRVISNPGIRVSFTLTPTRLSRTLPCIFNYTCAVVSNSLHIIA